MNFFCLPSRDSHGVTPAWCFFHPGWAALNLSASAMAPCSVSWKLKVFSNLILAPPFGRERNKSVLFYCFLLRHDFPQSGIIAQIKTIVSVTEKPVVIVAPVAVAYGVAHPGENPAFLVVEFVKKEHFTLLFRSLESDTCFFPVAACYIGVRALKYYYHFFILVFMVFVLLVCVKPWCLRLCSAPVCRVFV